MFSKNDNINAERCSFDQGFLPLVCLRYFIFKSSLSKLLLLLLSWTPLKRGQVSGCNGFDSRLFIMKNPKIFQCSSSFFCLFTPFYSIFFIFLMFMCHGKSQGCTVLGFHSSLQMENLREKMEIRGLPVIYTLSVETVACVFLLSACFCLHLPGSLKKQEVELSFYCAV